MKVHNETEGKLWVSITQLVEDMAKQCLIATTGNIEERKQANSEIISMRLAMISLNDAISAVQTLQEKHNV